MKSIYISSTRLDLDEHRKAAIKLLAQGGYTVEAMEKYSARDDRPKDAVEADVARCDIYVGIFAWSYGSVPPDNNPGGKSITELEYLAAGRATKPRLVFLLSDVAPWPPSKQDAHLEGGDGGQRIREFRKLLKREQWVGEFNSPEDLAAKVLIAVLQQESIKQANQVELLQEINQVEEVGPSYINNLQEKFERLHSAEFVTMRLGPVPWWNTRLHLVAGLALDFTLVRQLIFLDEYGRFLTMSSPAEVRRSLTKALPKLEKAYLESREAAQGWQGNELQGVLYNYPDSVQKVFGMPEKAVKQIVDAIALQDLAIRPSAEVIELDTSDGIVSPRDIIQRRLSYVVLTRQRKLERLIDRDQMASQIARNALR